MLWVAAWFGDSFVWRGNPMTVASGTQARAPATMRIRRIVDKTKERAKALATLRH
ncbi:hypothetical protein D3C72_2486570 [compost metagenome]